MTADDPRLAPIAGVDLAMYARASKTAAQEGLTTAGVMTKAQSFGIAADVWQRAATGWPARMRGGMAQMRHMRQTMRAQTEDLELLRSGHQ
ncbi:hypothetical protein ABT297_39685 [Dactylosporangium sp. NPDC000555]|uniref:hypothetical protein n=1 Tax=Dactylosporangium sp. NPDC000555 TaxID=3154260 RepID=UPI0033299ED8